MFNYDDLFEIKDNEELKFKLEVEIGENGTLILNNIPYYTKIIWRIFIQLIIVLILI